MNTIDHIAIAASDLKAGVDWFETLVGVRIPQGGKHPLMSTHNCLAQLAQGQYIEILAVDPGAPAPNRPRWFNLDDSTLTKQLVVKPKALTWVVATQDIESLVARSAIPLGEIVSMSRGDLHWKLTIPKDGSLLENGFVPYFIQWPGGKNPSSHMSDVGLELLSIHLHHPDPDYLNGVFSALRIDHLAQVHQCETPRIEFVFADSSGKTCLVS